MRGTISILVGSKGLTDSRRLIGICELALELAAAMSWTLTRDSGRGINLTLTARMDWKSTAKRACVSSRASAEFGARAQSPDEKSIRGSRQ